MRNWKRYKEAKRLRDSGLTLKAIGEAMNVSATRVQRMLMDLERRERRNAPATPLPQETRGTDHEHQERY